MDINVSFNQFIADKKLHAQLHIIGDCIAIFICHYTHCEAALGCCGNLPISSVIPVIDDLV